MMFEINAHLKERSLKKMNDLTVTLFWKTALILLGSLSLLTVFIRISGFWSSYILDMAGPAWIYILLRGQYTSKSSFPFFGQLTPAPIFFLCLGICFTIETSQYFSLYDAYFDPYDYLAYASIITPIFLIDKLLQKKNVRRTKRGGENDTQNP